MAQPAQSRLQRLLDRLGDPGAAACVARGGALVDEAVTGPRP